jgi:peptidoglycan/xylan/chitin deacetylase (PgdA/CDA1 family)
VTRVRAAARALGAFALNWSSRLGGKCTGVVIVYHRVGGPEGDPRREILPAISSEAFEAQLRGLRRRYRVVAASGVVEAARRRGRGQRFPVAITFDDDLRCHIDHALPALRRSGLTATFFLTGTSLAAPHAFWWEDLQRAVDEGLVAADAVPHVPEADLRAALERRPRAIFRVAEAIEGLGAREREQVAQVLRAAVGAPPDPGLRAADVRILVDSGCDIGFHTAGHDALPTLSNADLDQALNDGRSEVEAAAGQALEVIAYPHGKADERVADAARRAGYSAGFTTRRDAVAVDADPLLLPRVVPALSADKTTIRIARAIAR